jgi:S1/P1 Nuclease
MQRALTSSYSFPHFFDGPLVSLLPLLKGKTMKRILYFLCPLLLTTQLWAWGSKGHMIVAEIAQQRLTPAAQKSINELIPGLDLAAVANWPDTVRTQPEWVMSKPWHFVDLADGQRYEELPHSEEGNVITAITNMVEVLKSKTETVLKKQEAIKFLVHFMGDIHQPLHVGRPDDRGGNSIKVVYNGKNTNLHALWDSGMINTANLDYRQYAATLENQNPFNPPYDTREITFSQIIDENMSARQQIYDFVPANDAPIFIQESYVLRNKDLMNARMVVAGKRLAIVLNEIFN